MSISEKKLLFIVFFILIVFFIGMFIWINVDKPLETLNECVGDSDCVPAGCCHPNSCVSKNKAPNCEDIFCTLECEPGTLDCGQGSCGCVNGKCQAVFNEK